MFRKHWLGFDSISIRVVDSWPLSQILESPILSIRIDQVEDIVNRFISKDLFNHKLARYTSTFHRNLKYISFNSTLDEVEIKDEIDLDKIINEICFLVKNDGLSFFDSNRSLELINVQKKEQILTDESGMSYILRNLMQSLVLMKLCNDVDFDYLSIKYLKLYIPWEGHEESGNVAINSLIAYLKNLNIK